MLVTPIQYITRNECHHQLYLIHLQSHHYQQRPISIHISYNQFHPKFLTKMSLVHDINSSQTLTDIALGIQTVSEIPDFIDLPLTGLLPSYLAKSTLYRNGPGCYEITHPDGKVRRTPHWFDGYALLHQFSIDTVNNKVSYRSNSHSKGWNCSIFGIYSIR